MEGLRGGSSPTSIQEPHATAEPAHLKGMAVLRTCPQSSAPHVLKMTDETHVRRSSQASLQLPNSLLQPLSSPPSRYLVTHALCFTSVGLKQTASYFFRKKKKGVNLGSTENFSLGSATVVSNSQVPSKSREENSFIEERRKLAALVSGGHGFSLAEL